MGKPLGSDGSGSHPSGATSGFANSALFPLPRRVVSDVTIRQELWPQKRSHYGLDQGGSD